MTLQVAINYWKRVHNYLYCTQVKTVFISQTAMVSSFNYLHLGEGFFAEVSWPKSSCQTKSYWSYWGGK